MIFKNRVALIIEGGIGDNITATPMIRSMRKKYPKFEIGVIGSYGEVFFYNPNIDVLGDYGNPGYFYDSFIKNARICYRRRVEELRIGTDLHNFSVCEAWCKLYDLEYDGGNADIFLTEQEEQTAKEFMSQFKKPVILIQIQGAVGKGTLQKISNVRAWVPEEAEKVIDAFKHKYSFVQADLGGKDLNGVEWKLPVVPTRNLIALVKYCSTFICMDSFWQHVSRCFGKKGVVLFGGSNPATDGYDHNINIYHAGVCKDQPCYRPEGVILDFMPRTGFEQQPQLWNCPNPLCMKSIKAEEVIEALEKVLKNPKQ